MEEEEEEEKVLTLTGCFIWLGIVTVFISFLSDYIMSAIKDASVELHVPMPFLTTIVVPIVGNAAEHASALIFAYKNRMEIALGVAVGKWLAAVQHMAYACTRCVSVCMLVQGYSVAQVRLRWWHAGTISACPAPLHIHSKF